MRSRIAPLLTLAALAAGIVLAQSFQGGVRGTIMDSTGAAIGLAKVTLTEEATGLTRSTISGTGGEYTFTAINPAVYRITVEQPGFKTLERKGVTVGTQELLIDRPPVVLYRFAAGLAVRDVVASDTFLTYHAQYEREGTLQHPFAPAELVHVPVQRLTVS